MTDIVSVLLVVGTLLGVVIAALFVVIASDAEKTKTEKWLDTLADEDVIKYRDLQKDYKAYKIR